MHFKDKASCLPEPTLHLDTGMLRLAGAPRELRSASVTCFFCVGTVRRLNLQQASALECRNAEPDALKMWYDIRWPHVLEALAASNWGSRPEPGRVTGVATRQLALAFGGEAHNGLVVRDPRQCDHSGIQGW